MKFRDVETDSLVISTRNGHKMSAPVEKISGTKIVSLATCVNCGAHCYTVWYVPENYVSQFGSALQLMCEKEVKPDSSKYKMTGVFVR